VNDDKRTNSSQVSDGKKDGWLTEKSERIVEGLAQIVELTQKFEQDIPEEFESQLTSLVGTILWDATKILSYACGDRRKWSPEDRDVIMENGYEAHRAIISKYKGADVEFVTSLDVLDEKLEQLLEGPRSNRTLIHDLLRHCVVKSPIVDAIRDFTENISMGEMNWDEYVAAVRGELHKLETR
jgi:hypothetical protein